MRKLIGLFVFLMFLGIQFSMAQEKQVTGKVTDATDGLPLPGVTIMVKGSSIGTATDIEGNYSLKVPQNAVLVFSFVGMKDQEIAVTGKNVINVKMVSKTEALDEVMVVAYGTAKKESFTGSAAVVDNKKLSKRTVANISKAIDGQTTGVVATSGGGQPGDGASIRIRGYGSINASSNPLYVVDGIPYDGTLSAINPNDIESMTILKDASAGALYGARGANGVVIINTKKGKAEKTNVNLKASWGWSSRGIKNYNLVNQKEFVQLTYEALRNDYIFNSNYDWETAKVLAMNSLSSTLGGESYNPFKNYTWETIIDPSTEQIQDDAKAAWDESWMDRINRKNALRQEYQFSISGGTEKTQTLFSLGYLNEDGVLETTKFERYNARLNLDNQPKFWLKAGLNIAFSHSKQNYSMYTGSSNSNVWYTAQFMAPIYPVYMKDSKGNDLLDENGKKQLDYGKNRPKLSNFNSIATLEDDKSDLKNDNLSARTYLTLGSDDEKAGILKGLKFTMNFGVDYLNQNQMNYYNMYHGNFSSSKGLLSKYNTRTQSYTFNQLLTYNRSFADHSFDVMLGHEYYDYRYNYLYGSKTGLVDGIFELAPATTVNGTSSYQQDYRIESWLARLNYNYKEKYYLSGSFRTDGSSRFHQDNRWGNFWSVGANWRVSQEDFLHNTDWLDNLALKVSYGVQGNDDLLDSQGYSIYYAWQSFYDLTWPNANNAGGAISSLENKDITWEKNKNLNIGLDSRFFNGRLEFAMEYYNKKTTDMLLSFPMALSTGFGGYSANVGEMVNQGFEFTLGGTIIDKTDFRWKTTLMVSTVKNEVKKLTDSSDEMINGIYSIKVGNAINTFYIAKSAGVDPATGAQLYWAYEAMDANGHASGEYITSDYSVAANCKYYLGNRIPDLFGSINMEFNFLKNFDVSVLSTYSVGGKVYDGLYQGSMNIQYAGDTWNKHSMRRWSKPGDITDVPRVGLNPKNTPTDRFLVDASYFAIKNITVGYTLPNRILNRAGIESLRVFCTLDNLALFTHLDGMDPQYNFSGGTDYKYAPNKTISVGVDINF